MQEELQLLNNSRNHIIDMNSIYDKNGIAESAVQTDLIEKEENKDREKLSAILERPISSHDVQLISLASELASQSILSHYDHKNINDRR